MSGNPLKFSITPTLQTLELSFLARHQVQLSVLRLDQMHPQVNGNKAFKLKHNISAILEQGAGTVLSFGGAWSNHLLALAYAGRAYGFATVGVIRGEMPRDFNPVLALMREQGMELHFVSRLRYRDKESPEFLSELRGRFGPFYLLPEGGSNHEAVLGCQDIARHLQWASDSTDKLVAVACGTGATLSGIILGLERREEIGVQALGVNVLKAPAYIAAQVDAWLAEFESGGKIGWSVTDEYHCGGYAKRSEALEAFLRCFRKLSDIPLEPVYTGKLAFALQQLIAANKIKPGTEVIAIHSGGLLPNLK